jgi:hypothetical protein
MSSSKLEFDLADGVSKAPLVGHKLVPIEDFERNRDITSTILFSHRQLHRFH